MTIQEQLQNETVKWLKKLEEEMVSVEKNPITDTKVQEEVVNITAYIADCRHFLNKKDVVHAFEAVMYGWGIFDTLARLKLIKTPRFQD